MKHKLIGVLGGIGTESTVGFYQNIVRYAQSKYDAVQDSDYPHMVIYNLPTSYTDKTGFKDLALVKYQLINAVKKLELIGCDLIVICCNTSYHFYEDLQSTVSTTIIDLIGETKKSLLNKGYKNIGLLCSESSIKLGVYQKKFKEMHLNIPNEKQQKVINRIIFDCMSGSYFNHTNTLKNMVTDMLNSGSEIVIIGCSELSLIVNRIKQNIKIFDTMDALSKLVVDYSLLKKDKIDFDY